MCIRDRRDTRQKVCFLISIKVRKVFPKDKILPSGKTNVPFQEGGSAILTDRTEVIDKNLFIQNTSSSIKERKIRPVRIEKPFFCPQIFFRLSFRFRAIKCFTCFQQPEEYSNQSSIRFVIFSYLTISLFICSCFSIIKFISINNFSLKIAFFLPICYNILDT